MDTGQATYEKLDYERKEIRLLLLKPGIPSEDVHCDLNIVSLLDDPKIVYNTVSYVWGDPNLKSTIYISNRCISVGASAARVLRRFRHRTEHLVLWLDAVCINQHDLQERSQQVAIMADIYSNGVQNLIWLGEDEGDFAAQARHAIGVIVEDAEREAETRDDHRIWDFLHTSAGNLIHSTLPLAAKDVDWEHLLTLYDLPWFRRLWVVQEAALSTFSTFHCGDVEIELRQVLLAATWLHHKDIHLHFPMRQHPGIINSHVIWEMMTRATGYSPTSSRRLLISNLLMECQQFEAYDPRDHIYGVLGLYQALTNMEQLPAVLLPDYTKQAGEVFAAAARVAIVEEQHPFYGLNHRVTSPGFADSPIELSLPTWVPHFDRQWDLMHDATPLGSHFSADAQKSLELVASPLGDARVLAVKGFVINQVSRTCKVRRRADLVDTGNVMEIINEVKELLASEEGSHGDDAALATILCGGLDCWQKPLAGSNAQAQLEALLSFISKGEFPKPLRALGPGEASSSVHHETKLAAGYDQAMFSACRNRRAFLSRDCRVGLGPQTMEPGDVIAVVYGCKWPVILRPRLDDGHYEVRGVAYVHGIMFGEAVREQEAGDPKETIFLLH